MHITVDGKPIDDPDRSSSDVQRCTDAALDAASIRFRFDNLESRPRLAVAAHPVAVPVSDQAAVQPQLVVRFRMYNNYASFISTCRDPDLRAAAVTAGDAARDHRGRRRGPRGMAAGGGHRSTGPTRELKYLLRAYDSKGNFDETDARPLWLYREPSPGAAAAPGGAVAARAAGRLRRERPGAPADSARRRHGEGAGQRHTGRTTRCGWRAARCRSTRRATSPRRRFCRRARTRSKSRCSTRRATARCIFATWSSSAEDLFYVGVADLTRGRESRERAGRSAAGRERTAAVRFDGRWPAGVLRERPGQRDAGA